jgi:hypothetical protein
MPLPNRYIDSLFQRRNRNMNRQLQVNRIEFKYLPELMGRGVKYYIAYPGEDKCNGDAIYFRDDGKLYPDTPTYYDSQEIATARLQFFLETGK